MAYGTREIEGFKGGVEAMIGAGFLVAARGLANGMRADEQRKVAAIRASVSARVAARTAQLVAASCGNRVSLEAQLAASQARLREAGVL